MQSKIRLNKNPERAVKEIEDLLNKLNDRISLSSTNQNNKTQDIRMTPVDNGEWKLEIKTDKGWVESDASTASGFKLKS